MAPGTQTPITRSSLEVRLVWPTSGATRLDLERAASGKDRGPQGRSLFAKSAASPPFGTRDLSAGELAGGADYDTGVVARIVVGDLGGRLLMGFGQPVGREAVVSPPSSVPKRNVKDPSRLRPANWSCETEAMISARSAISLNWPDPGAVWFHGQINWCGGGRKITGDTL